MLRQNFACLLILGLLIPSFCVKAQNKQNGWNKNWQEAIGDSLRKDADRYKKAAESNKGELAETLYSLALACNEEASLREKIGSSNEGHNFKQSQAYRARLPYLVERVKNLKEKAASLGYVEPKNSSQSTDSSGSTEENDSRESRKKKQNKP